MGKQDHGASGALTWDERYEQQRQRRNAPQTKAARIVEAVVRELGVRPSVVEIAAAELAVEGEL